MRKSPADYIIYILLFLQILMWVAYFNGLIKSLLLVIILSLFPLLTIVGLIGVMFCLVLFSIVYVFGETLWKNTRP